MNLWTLISHLISFASLIFKPNTLIIHKPHFKVYMHLKRNLRTWKMFLRQSTKILVTIKLNTNLYLIAKELSSSIFQSLSVSKASVTPVKNSTFSIYKGTNAFY